MKKVLFVATVTTHINAFHIPYLKWFKEQGYEVHVASNGNEKIEYCDKHFDLPFARFPLKVDNMKAYKELKKIIETNNYTIIHCHTPVGGVLTRLAAKESRKKGSSVIYTAHGFHFYKGAPLLNWIIYYPIEKYLSKYTDCLITINKEDYERAQKKFNVNKVVFIYGVGVDSRKFNIEITNNKKEKMRKELNIEKDNFVIIFPAELSKRKNQSMLIKTISTMKIEGYTNIRVLLVGTDSRNKYYQKLAKKLELEKEILFLGKRNDIPELLKISDLLVSTSKQEGLPVNIMEATFSGLPIVATNCRGNRDIVKQLVEIGDIKQLSNCIKDAMNNREKYICIKDNKYELNTVLEEMKKIQVMLM